MLYIRRYFRPCPPIGSINWLIEVDDYGIGRLLENSESNLIIGVLSASDPNPYDEVTFSLASQNVDGVDVNFFQ